MNLSSFIFYLFEVLAASSTIAILFIRNVFYGALLLIVCLLSLAGLYVLAFAEFIAVTQILIYAGGIVVVILFGIMLTTKISGKPLEVKNTRWFSGSLVGISLLILLLNLFSIENFSATSTTTSSASNDIIQQTGISLMSDYVLPFEISGILLLVALVGAAVTTSTVNQK